ncbi:MAG: LysR family transcriptional regulator [Acidobacteria bacterium]|nr:LysR family transcriptional regulator [Acidobacteriota bacterium]
MPAPFVIGVVTGVTPDRWVRVWRERLPEVPLQVVPVDDVAVALASGVSMVFARLPVEGVDPERLHTIALWEETPVAVAAKDHVVKAFDAVTEADLADEEVHPGWGDGVLDIVAAGHGIARMPQSVFRASGRRDVVARPITDAPSTRIALVWSRDEGGPLVDEFIGVVRGRTANSSRGDAAAPPPEAAKPLKAPQTGAKAPARQDRRPRRPSSGKRHR